MNSDAQAFTVAFAHEEERAEFIRKTYLHLAGAVGLFVLLEVFFIQYTPLPQIMLNFIAGNRYGWMMILGAFVLMQVSWPLLSVGANVLIVRLNPGARGESIGLFNASTSLGSSIGSALGGVLFGLYGFSTLSGVAVGAVAVSIGLASLWWDGQKPNAA